MPRNSKTSKKAGRGQEIEPKELLRRYAALKRFLEDNWGRIGLDLPRVRQPEDVKSVLNRVKSAQWCPAFRDFPTGCLLQGRLVRASWREVRATREKYEDSKSTEGRLSLESHTAHQASQNARTAFEAAVAESEQQQDSKRNQRRLKEIAKQLRLEELSNQAKELGASLRTAQVNREVLATLLGSQEGWFACNEVVEFVQDRKRRYRKTPSNFAKAMAGLPFYDWLYSLRKCKSIPSVGTVPTAYWFRVFEMLRRVVNRTRPANLMKVQLKLKNELLKEDIDPLLRAYISPQWFYMKLAFADCRGKRFRTAHLPYKVMEKFLDHCEGPSVAEHELAKYHQLV
jgi:hypothetical protein